MEFDKVLEGRRVKNGDTVPLYLFAKTHKNAQVHVRPANLKILHRAPFFFKMACKQNLDLRCVLISDPGTLGAGAKTRLHTPKAVTYHEQ